MEDELRSVFVSRKSDYDDDHDDDRVHRNFQTCIIIDWSACNGKWTERRRTHFISFRCSCVDNSGQCHFEIWLMWQFFFLLLWHNNRNEKKNDMLRTRNANRPENPSGVFRLFHRFSLVLNTVSNEPSADQLMIVQLYILRSQSNIRRIVYSFSGIRTLNKNFKSYIFFFM